MRRTPTKLSEEDCVLMGVMPDSTKKKMRRVRGVMEVGVDPSSEEDYEQMRREGLFGLDSFND